MGYGGEAQLWGMGWTQVWVSGATETNLSSLPHSKLTVAFRGASEHSSPPRKAISIG